MSSLHISLDDTKGIFKALLSEEYKSIFETRTLSFLQKLHLKYGSEFTLYCSYRDWSYQLSDVSDRYREEFESENTWLHFGFHCFDERAQLKNVELHQFISQFSLFEKQIERIVGQKDCATILRLHGFQGNKEILSFLKEKGVTIFLSSDDERQNYYLDENQNYILQNDRRFYDKDMNIEFVRSCVRLENANTIIEDLNFRKQRNDNLIPVYTHEWQMDNQEVRERLELCCEWGVEKSDN